MTCKKCLGYGFVVYSYDPSAAGVSLSPGKMLDINVCSCVEDGWCPKCGKLIPYYQWQHCDACGWTWKGDDDSLNLEAVFNVQQEARDE